MIDFNKAYIRTIRHEGGYVNDPDDTGGETIFGISRRNNPTWSGWIIVDKIKAGVALPLNILTLNRILNSVELSAQAKILYKKNYWGAKIDSLYSQNIADVFFDTAVNMGFKTASIMLQKAYNICKGSISLPQITEDGIIGDVTISKINSLIASHPTQMDGGDVTIVNTFISLRIQKYFDICFLTPSQNKFLRGWLNRTVNYIIK